MVQSLQYTKVQMNDMIQKSSQKNIISSKQVPNTSFYSVDIQPKIPLNVSIMDTAIQTWSIFDKILIVTIIRGSEDVFIAVILPKKCTQHKSKPYHQCKRHSAVTTGADASNPKATPKI